MSDDPFVDGTIAALEGFREQLERKRDLIEASDEPLDLILDCLEKSLRSLRGFQPRVVK